MWEAYMRDASKSRAGGWDRFTGRTLGRTVKALRGSRGGVLREPSQRCRENSDRVSRLCPVRLKGRISQGSEA